VDYNKPLRPGPNELGFDYAFGFPNSHNMPPFVYVRNGEVVGRKPGEKIIFKPNTRVKNPRDISTISAKRIHDKMGPRLTQEACDFIRREHANPFFLYLPTGAVHSPITPCEEVLGSSNSGKYGDFIRQFDWTVGQVVETLKQCGVYENTLLVITSDNGGQEHFAKEVPWPINGPWRGQKSMVYEGGHRVPFIARWPGIIPAGRSSAAPLSLVDMTATFAALCGEKLPDGAAPDSVNVLPALLGKTEDDLHKYMILHSTRGEFAIRRGDWKLIDCPDGGGYEKAAPGAPPIQLFNLKDDPQEKENLWQQDPEKTNVLKELLEKEKDRII
jgi:arylsulfatase A-like enzyme